MIFIDLFSRNNYFEDKIYIILYKNYHNHLFIFFCLIIRVIKIYTKNILDNFSILF